MRQRLQATLNREPTVGELSAETGLSPEDIMLALDSSGEVESIYKTVYQGDGASITLIDRLEEKRDAHEEVLNRLLLQELLEDLDGRNGSSSSCGILKSAPRQTLRPGLVFPRCRCPGWRNGF